MCPDYALLSLFLPANTSGHLYWVGAPVGASRPTLYDWLTKPKPRIDNPRHRQAIAEVTQLDQRSVDMLIVNGLGYHLAPVRAEAVTLAVLVSKLDAEDISNLERQALAMLRRDAELRKGRRGKSTPAP